MQAALTPRRHSVNICRSLPLGTTWVDRVLLAGTEGRSPAHPLCLC
ncbi:hypothetical protein [Phormidium tenue]|nr:hypothetical protein [Phormidium tenue]